MAATTRSRPSRLEGSATSIVRVNAWCVSILQRLASGRTTVSELPEPPVGEDPVEVVG
jgi:hypothetical protein